MRKMNVLQFYAAAVCFFTAIVATISGGGAVYDIVQMSAPQFGISGQAVEAHRSNRAFSQWHTRRHRDFDGHVPRRVRERMEDHGIDLPPVAGQLALPESEEELTQLRNESFASLLAAKQHNAIKDFVREIIALLIAGGLFFVHWRLLRRLHNEKE